MYIKISDNVFEKKMSPKFDMYAERQRLNLLNEKKNIICYGSCSICMLEKQLGHIYIAKTWDCECGKKFQSF